MELHYNLDADNSIIGGVTRPVNNVPTPINSGDLVNKSYIDSLVPKASYKREYIAPLGTVIIPLVMSDIIGYTLNTSSVAMTYFIFINLRFGRGVSATSSTFIINILDNSTVIDSRTYTFPAGATFITGTNIKMIKQLTQSSVIKIQGQSVGGALFTIQTTSNMRNNFSIIGINNNNFTL